MNSTLKRQKSISSHAASISAWWRGLRLAEHRRGDQRVERHGPARSSAARRKTEARSSHGIRDQSACASRAAPIARCTCSAPPCSTSARTWCCGAASRPESSPRSRPPCRRSRSESRSARAPSGARRTRSSSRSGVPARRCGPARSGFGGSEDPSRAHGAIVESASMRRDAASLRGRGLGRGELVDRRRARRGRPRSADAWRPLRLARCRGTTPQTTPRGTPGVPTETLSAESSQDGDGFVANCSNRSTATSAASASRLQMCRWTATGRRRSRKRWPRRSECPVGRGRQLRRALRHSPAGSGRHAAAGTVLRREPLLALRPVPPRRRRERDRRLRVARRRVQAPAAPPRGVDVMTLSDDLRSELAAIAPKRGCCRLAEISALFHSAGSIHLRGRGEISLASRPGDLRRRPPRVLASARARDPLRDPHLQPPLVRPRNPLPAPCHRDEPALAMLVEAGVLDARHAPVERPPKRVVGRACCRGAYLRGALLGGGSLSGPRRPHLELRTTSWKVPVPAGGRGRGRRELGVLDRGRHAVAYAKGLDSIEAVLRPPERGHRPRFEERSVIAAARGRGEPAGERRPRQSRPHEPRRARAARGVAVAPGCGRARAVARPPARDRTASAPVSDLAAARAGSTLRAADDEGLRAPAASKAPGARNPLEQAISHL